MTMYPAPMMMNRIPRRFEVFIPGRGELSVLYLFISSPTTVLLLYSVYW